MMNLDGEIAFPESGDAERLVSLFTSGERIDNDGVITYLEICKRNVESNNRIADYNGFGETF